MTNSSWDDFKREVFGARTETIEGVEVRVPADVPFGFEQRLAELTDSAEQEDVEELVAVLFGPDTFDQLTEAGVGQIGMLTILTWGMARASGNAITFQQAYEAITSGDLGKAFPQTPQNRAERRGQSKSTGGRSKPTSRASTGSARRTSRA
ncbi:hypothetical protein [Streptomyces roseicoloratus]|uniref:hypothetical protein n=1 Tax=Streptomyces roseicoloratus TaxID=2508722 RepID=UPI00100995FC|nr:hypothetical protein [Streptomyces roseicoloratus]